MIGPILLLIVVPALQTLLVRRRTNQETPSSAVAP